MTAFVVTSKAWLIFHTVAAVMRSGFCADTFHTGSHAFKYSANPWSRIRVANIIAHTSDCVLGYVVLPKNYIIFPVELLSRQPLFTF
jgi:hypothetical protein